MERINGYLLGRTPRVTKCLKVQIGEEYDKRREALKSFYNAQYVLRRTRSLLVLTIFAIIAFRVTDKQKEAEQKIAQLKQERQLLISNTTSFKKYSNYVRDELKAGREPCEMYLKTMNFLLKAIDENQNERRNANKKERSSGREDR